MGSFTSQQIKKILIVGPSCTGKTTLIYKLKLGDIYDPAINEVYTSLGTVSDAVSFGDYRFIEITNLDDYYDNTPQNEIKQNYLQNAEAIIFFVDSTDKDRLENGEYNKYLKIISEVSREKAIANTRKSIFSSRNSINKPSVTGCKIYSKYESTKAIPLLILCSKQDLRGHVPYCASTNEIGVRLGLYQWMDYKLIFRSSNKMISYDCPDNVIDIIIGYIPDHDKDIVGVNEKKRMFHIHGCCTTTGDGLYEGLDIISKIYKR